MTSSVVRLRRSSKALPKAKLAPKNRSWSLFGCLMLVWSTNYSFLNPSKTISSEKYLSKSMRCTENCNACSQHWSTERAQFFSTMSNCTSHNQCLKSWTNWARKFCLIHHTHLTSHQPTTTPSSISQLFAGKVCPQPAGGRKCFLRVHEIPKHGFLHYMNKQTYLSSAKTYWL